MAEENGQNAKGISQMAKHRRQKVEDSRPERRKHRGEYRSLEDTKGWRQNAEEKIPEDNRQKING